MRLAQSIRSSFPNGMTLLWVPSPGVTCWRVFAVSETSEIADVTASLAFLTSFLTGIQNVEASDRAVWLHINLKDSECPTEELQAIGDKFSVQVYGKAGHVMCASANCLGDADWEGEE
ncbi:MAG: hypothetical protein HC841_00160 [Verrucomicrobiae bacterium]|nr:hypothetical protein [Verrucomicrobiae bacterium]